MDTAMVTEEEIIAVSNDADSASLTVPRVMVDLAELSCHEILIGLLQKIPEKDNMAAMVEESNRLSYYLDRLGGVWELGRLYTRLAAVDLAMDIGSRPIRQKIHEPETDEIVEDRLSIPLSELSHEHWCEVLEKTNNLQKIMLRIDADELVVPTHISEMLDKEKSNETLHPVQQQVNSQENAKILELPIFSTEFETAQSLLEIHGAASKFKALVSSCNLESKEQLKKVIDDFRATASNILLKLLENQDDEEKANSTFEMEKVLSSFSPKNDPQTMIADLDETLLSNEYFSLASLQRYMIKLIASWCSVVLTVPTLVKIDYGKQHVPPFETTAFEEASCSSMSAERAFTKGHVPVLEDIEEEEDVEEDSAKEPEPLLTQSPRPKNIKLDGGWNGDSNRGFKKLRKLSEESKNERTAPKIELTITTARVSTDSTIPINKRTTRSDIKKRRTATGLDLLTPVLPVHDDVYNLKETKGQSLTVGKKVQDLTLVPKKRTIINDSSDDDDDDITEPEKIPVPKKGRKTTNRKKTATSETPASFTVTPIARGRKRPTRSPASTTSSRFIWEGIMDDNDDDDDNSEENIPTKRRSYSRQPMDDNDDDDDYSEENIPTKRRSRSRQPINVQEGASRDRSATPSKRNRFTEIEKHAIKKGLELYGVGRWVDIKDYMSEELSTRTTVNIKDCYRTMVKRGEIIPVQE
eukprot:scaffold23434_cov53-Attheya_sp.AAC.3